MPVLAFPAVHGKYYGLAVGAVKGFVFVQDDLDEIVAGGNVVEVADGIAESGFVEGDGLAGLERVHIEAEDHLRAHRVADLQARFGGGIGGEDQQQATVEWGRGVFALGTTLRNDTTEVAARAARLR